MRKSKKYNAEKVVKSLARERVGTVPAAKVIVPKNLRKKAKYKKAVGLEE